MAGAPPCAAAGTAGAGAIGQARGAAGTTGVEAEGEAEAPVSRWSLEGRGDAAQALSSSTAIAPVAPQINFSPLVIVEVAPVIRCAEYR
jgi:hypothetical protein